MSLSSNQTYVVLGVLMQFLVAPDATSGNVAMLHSELRPGTIIPLHNHADSEIFYLPSGSLEAYEEQEGWKTFGPGQAIAITGRVKHAIRNVSDKSALAIAVTGRDLYSFFAELAAPLESASPSAPPTPEQMQHLFAVAAKYGYWLGSPEDNAAIGITLG
ncbi:MAG TPA: cupin domain-containing protein [Acidobacteriaceae bacterium]